MKRFILAAFFLLVPALALGTTVPSSALHFQGTLTDNGDGTYTGVLPVTVDSGFDIFAKEGDTAWFGDDPGTGEVWTPQAIGADHDAWPTWDPDTPDWYAYSIYFYADGGVQKWALRNHPGATADHPWYDTAYWGSEKPAMGVPMSGTMDWATMYATETDAGAYLPGTGTPEIPGGAAAHGGGAGAWDMDWSWGSEVVPLQYAGFSVSLWNDGTDDHVTMTPAPPLVVDPDWAAFIIRNNATDGPPLIYGNGAHGVMGAPEFAVFASGQKAGLGTDKINGALVSAITSLHIDRLDDVASSGSLYGPYFNIWVTDGLGNYAVIANEPSNAEWGGDPWDVADWNDLRTKYCKVYEVAGWDTGTSWVHTYALAHGWDGVLADLTFEHVAGLTIEPPSPAYIAASADIGSGAPDELGTNIARGYNWIFGDTASNYVTGAGEGFVVDNYTATATFPVNNITQGIGYATIAAAVADANSGDTITVDPGTYVQPSQLLIDKDLTIIGSGSGNTTIMPGYDTTTGSYLISNGLVYVDYGVAATFEDLAIDGTGHTVFNGIQSRGANLTMRNCEVRNIYAGTYLGFGITYLTGTGLLENCQLSNIQRVGVQVRGAIEPTPPDVTMDGLTYTGKGDGDFLDYGVEFGGGGTGTITNSTFTDCRGVAATDGSTSAGIYATTYFGPGTAATITNTTLTANYEGLTVGYLTDDTSVVAIHDCVIAGNTHEGVEAMGLDVDATGNWWGDATGPLDVSDDTATGGLYNPGGLGDAVSDHVLYEPWSGMGSFTVTPAATGPVACGETHTLTFNLTTDDYTPDVFGFNAVVRASGELGWGTITSLQPFGTTTQFLTFDNGDGSWMISGTTVGSPTQPISGPGTYGLFTIDFTTAAEGTGSVTFDSFSLRDPSNAPIPATAVGATFTIDCTPPAPVTDITAAPGYRKVDVAWSHDGTDVDHYEVFSGLWYDTTPGVSAYPEYDDLAGDVIPTRPASYAAAAGSAEWAGPFTAAGLAFTQQWTDSDHRGVYYYEVFAVDAAGNVSAPAAANDRATNYWLGDTHGAGADPVPNGVVDAFDMNDLGTYFGSTIPTGGAGDFVDVGPTDDWSRLGIPTTDSRIDFEDLMVFSMNFGVVSAAKDKQPVSGVVSLAWIHTDDGTMALRLVEGGGLKGLRVTAAHPVGSVTAGGLLDEQSELTFLRNVGENLDASVAVMGVNNAFTGQGDLMVIRADEAIPMEDLHITARGTDNSDLKVKLEQTSGSVTPRVFSLNANYPNPFNPMTKISFSLPEAQDVRLTVYGVDGKKVATLIDDRMGAGLHEVVWTGRDDSGKSVATGTYFYQIKAGPYSQVRKMTLVK